MGAESGWLFQVATSAAFDRYRRQRIQPTTSLTDYHSNTITAAANGLNNEAGVLIRLALDSLPTYQSTPLLLSYVGCQIQDIAVLLGWKLGMVMSRMSRARAHMRKHYAIGELAA